MNKYAEIYDGKVRDIQESELDFTDFHSLWDPASYWVDVSGIEDIAPGWVVNFDLNRGRYFSAPPEQVDTETLEYQKKYRLALIKSMLEKQLAGEARCCSSLGIMVNSDTAARENIAGLLAIYGENDKFEFVDYFNKKVNLNITQLKLLYTEVVGNIQKLYEQKWAMRDALNAAGTLEELDAVELTYRNWNYQTGAYLTGEEIDAMEAANAE